MNIHRTGIKSCRPLVRSAATALIAMALAPAAFGQLTDIASTPLTTSAPNQVKPNLLFILDDSGSMGRDYMPDEANYSSSKYGRFAAQCNGLAYNPSTDYRLPVDSTGADYPAGTFTFPPASDLNNIRTVSSASPTTTLGTGSFTLTLANDGGSGYSNGNTVTVYSSTNSADRMVGTVSSWNGSTRVLVVNVTEVQGSGTFNRIGTGDNRPYYYTYGGSETALGYTYNSSGLITSTTFYQQCNSNVGSTPGSTVFTRVTVTPATVTQNYRNWATYYRTRLLMAKAATSLAFRTIGDRFRVGFTTISSTRVSGSNFLDVADFDTGHKGSFYTDLFGATAPAGNYTPLRGALAKAGKYYAFKGTRADGTDQTYDPVQFSCQKNFAILTTDGYWNTEDEVTGSGSSSYGPDRLDRTDVGQQDGAGTPRPMLDGATSVQQTRTSALQQRTVGAQWQTATQTLQSRTGQLQTRTSSNSGGSYGSWSNTASCQWVTTGTNRRQCQYNWGGWSNAASCTVNYSTSSANGTTWTGNGTDCRYNPSTLSYVNTASCTAVAPSTGPNYTVSTATYCQQVPTYSAWTNVASCSATSTTECQYTNWTGWSNVASCTAAARSTAPNYTVGTARECQTISSGGVSNSLADVAMYYYNTDLRDTALNNCVLGSGTNVCTNNVPPRGSDTATHQHMSTFTVGMGVNGTLRYASNYTSGGSSDYNDIVQGTRDWPDPIASTTAARIDDLWHAAVNGRGQYFNAGDPASLSQGLTAALTAIDAQTGSGSGAAASTLQPVAGDNSLFIAKYTTVHWTGELVSRSIDPQTGEISGTDNWSAEQLLDARVGAGTARNIYYMQRTAGANTGVLRSFTYANLNADGYGGHFSNVCSKTVPLSQCADSGYDTASANSGINMVNYLRGTSDVRYRTRQHILGDIVGGAPVYVRRPSFQYTENNYASFAAANASRTGVVYVAANDGMLHAFNGTTGQEMWAYVPSMVMDRMYRLADNDYANRHEFLVNGAPVVGDIWVPGSPGAWKTILVGGLGAGGQGYYALDITDPSNPQALWEFSNDSLGGANNLGLTFGNPVITKRADGTWVVAFTSGYNNVVSGGDGNGRLFVVNANTGQRLVAIATETSAGVPAGTASAPSGLGKLNAWVESTIDNTARRYYAGDLLGNLWRFDIDNLVAPNSAALRLAQLRAGTPATAQPITTQPALGMVDYGGSQYPVVYVGTGRLLGLSDLSSTAVQSVYAIKDPLTNTPLGDVHASSTMVAQVLSQASVNAPRTVTNNAVDWSTQNGWYVDLIGSGERVNVDMQVIFQTLNVASNTPNNDACTAGGSSYLYHFNLNTGSAPIGSTDGVVGTWLGGTMVVGMSYLTLQQSGGDAGSGRTITVIVDNRGVPRTDDVPPPPPPPATGRRTSWRELVN